MQEKNWDAKDVKEKGFWEKVKKYKTEITIASVTVGVVIAGIVTHKNTSISKVLEKEEIAKILKTSKSKMPTLAEATKKDGVENVFSNKIINVPEYVRKLPNGQKHSLDKVEEALKCNYILAEDETWVKAYCYSKLSA